MDFDYDTNNIFAKILRGEIPNQTVFENDHALAFRDINPGAPVHVLVIPKGPYVSIDHFARDASPEEQVGFFAAVARVCEVENLSQGFRSIANTRTHGVQDVPHFHLHLIGGKQLGAMLPQS
ncbi:HIT domain-containing protein [Aestuariibius sp. HNIBRBA575]|uniref:HIT domain-containing protein n=1 Tax=Aestuariibius sp. HNIBRBA575 TaxID=3233343 RepID=UPI0034A236CD